MKKIRSFKDRSQPKKEKSFFVCVLIGAVLSLTIGMLMLVLSCFPMLTMEEPDRFAPVFALASLFLSAVFGAYIAARTHGKNGLACGALSSLLLVGVLVLLSFSFKMQIRPSLFAICAPALVVCSAIAGICGVSAKSAPRPKHKVKF